MRNSQFSMHGRGLTAINGALALIAILLMVQTWLLSATLDAYLSGHREVALPGAIVSGIIFAACTGLYLFVHRIESSAKDGDASATPSSSRLDPDIPPTP